MSTVAYQALTKRRNQAVPGTSDSTKPGIGKYADALAALVPAEVLAAHAFYLEMAGDTTESSDGTVTTITNPGALELGFWILVGAAAALYLLPKIRELEAWDAVRFLIPPLAFIAWTLIESPSAFDPVNGALRLNLDEATRWIIGIGAALILGALAAGLAFAADRNTRHMSRAELRAAGMGI
jgi:hypothetical protein